MKVEKEIENRLKKIAKIKERISQLGEVRPGSLGEQYNVCGNPNCRCKAPKHPRKHGPYYQLSYTRHGKSTSEFVRRDDVDMIRKHMADYQLLKDLCDQWIDISIELSSLRKKAKSS